jgi:hypothetical protein
MKNVAAGSLDPARARKATKETHDKVLCKLEAYISTLYWDQGKIPWKSFSEIPADRLYNMDEVGSDNTKRRARVIASATDMACLFQVMSEGDGKMNIHITACITICVKGKYPGWFFLGVPLGPWLLCINLMHVLHRCFPRFR